MHKSKKRRSIIYTCVVLVLVLVMIYSGLRIVESTVSSSATEAPVPSKTITRNGIDYYPRQDITVLLLIGVDRRGPAVDSGSYNNPGAADMVSLVIFDHANEVCNVLSLNRDTIVEMPVLGIGGKLAGTRTAQLALSHTYGSGLNDSCENVVSTVSQLLYGVTVDHYISMGMDGIVLLNDAVGGVTVNNTEDFSAVDPSIPVGAVKLMGQQAETFIRSRKDVGTQLNLSRMERQKEYMKGFLTSLRAKLDEDSLFIPHTYEEMSPHIVTDCSVNVISGILDRYGDYPLNEVVSPAGENVLGEQYYEFYVDEEALDALVLRLLYAPKR